VSAQERQDALLRRIVAADDAASDVFFTSSTQQGTTMFHEGFSGRQIDVGRGDIQALAARGLLAITEYRDNSDVAFAVTPQGHAHADQIEGANPATVSTSAPRPAGLDLEILVRKRAFDAWRETEDWPSVLDMQREAARRREGLDIEEIARRLDRSVGWIEPQDHRLVLRVQGMADLDGAEPYLDAFLRIVQMLHDRYVSEATNAVLSNEDLRHEGFDEGMVRRLFLMAEREWFLLGGGVGDESGAWSREPSTSIWRFQDVKTIADYLHVVAELTQPRLAVASIPLSANDDSDLSVAIPGFELLHPEVLSASANLFAGGHYAQAVMEAFKTVEVRVRHMSGLSTTGQKLMGSAFHKDNPRIALSTTSAAMLSDELDGFRFLFIGTTFLRNVFAHDFPEPDQRLAADYLALASLLLGRLDAATEP
jgi:uncharacterized protein (TIGR02391 family)